MSKMMYSISMCTWYEDPGAHAHGRQTWVRLEGRWMDGGYFHLRLRVEVEAAIQHAIGQEMPLGGM